MTNYIKRKVKHIKFYCIDCTLERAKENNNINCKYNTIWYNKDLCDWKCTKHYKEFIKKWKN